MPTVQEAAGFAYSINTWYAAFAPAKTPRPIVDKLNAAFNQVLKQPEVIKRAQELWFEYLNGGKNGQEK